MASDILSAALRYLKIRPRSVFELAEKLKRKGFIQKDIDETITRLINMKLLNDRAFADEWIRYRLARPFGFLRIIRELKEKGVSQELIESAVSQAKGRYSETDSVVELAKRRASRIAGLNPDKRNKRIFDFLIRRGFKADEAIKAIKKLGTNDVKYK